MYAYLAGVKAGEEAHGDIISSLPCKEGTVRWHQPGIGGGIDSGCHAVRSVNANAYTQRAAYIAGEYGCNTTGHYGLGIGSGARAVGGGEDDLVASTGGVNMSWTLQVGAGVITKVPCIGGSARTGAGKPDGVVADGIGE